MTLRPRYFWSAVQNNEYIIFIQIERIKQISQICWSDDQMINIRHIHIVPLNSWFHVKPGIRTMVTFFKHHTIKHQFHLTLVHSDLFIYHHAVCQHLAEIQTNVWIMDGRMWGDEWLDGWLDEYEWLVWLVGEWMDEWIWTDAWWIHEWMNKWLNEQTAGGLTGWLDGRMDTNENEWLWTHANGYERMNSECRTEQADSARWRSPLRGLREAPHKGPVGVGGERRLDQNQRRRGVQEHRLRYLAALHRHSAHGGSHG